MSRTSSIIVASLLVVGLVSATIAYRDAHPGQRLFAAYFDPVPPGGYGLTRGLGQDPATEASVLRQAFAYHRAADYDFALTALRNYLSTNPLPADDRAPLLAATAALANGYYAEADELLDHIPRNATTYSAALWYRALSALRMERPDAARAALIELASRPDAGEFRVGELTAKLDEVKK